MRDLTTALRLLPVRSLGHKRSSTVVLVLVGTMGAALVGQGLPTLFPFIQEDFKLSRAQVGLIVWSIGLGATLGVLPMGWLTDRLGARRPLAFSGIGAAVGLSLFSQANFLGQALLVGLLLGVATSASVPASTKATGRSAAPRILGDWSSGGSFFILPGKFPGAGPSCGPPLRCSDLGKRTGQHQGHYGFGVTPGSPPGHGYRGIEPAF